jgi:chromate reductase, NAD(P)H dehydrogenase (quinone)
MRILALPGSLRAASINAALLRATARIAPAGLSVEVETGLGQLPLFNPDAAEPPPHTVRGFQARVAAADALLIASPEYAHGVTGTIKNALDWLVGFEPFAYKPVAVLNASPRAQHADAALKETLRTMAATVVEPASVSIALLGAHLDEDGMVAAAWVATPIRAALEALSQAVARQRAAPSASFPIG